MKRKMLVDVVTEINDSHLNPVIDVINDRIVMNAMPAEIDRMTRSIASIHLDLDGVGDVSDLSRFVGAIRAHAKKVAQT